jgi:Uma2 family endonuclease
MSGLSTPEPGARRMTLAEWGDLGDDESGELVDGALVEEEVVGAVHDIVAAWILWALMSWIVPRGGYAGLSDTRFAVTPRRGRKPDLYVYFAGRKPEPRGLVTVPPDVMVEIVSPRPKDARRDRVDKRADYAAFGVTYYWIVDPQLRILEIHELGSDGRYVCSASASVGLVDRVPGFDGLVLDLDALWARVNEIEPERDDPA